MNKYEQIKWELRDQTYILINEQIWYLPRSLVFNRLREKIDFQLSALAQHIKHISEKKTKQIL